MPDYNDDTKALIAGKENGLLYAAKLLDILYEPHHEKTNKMSVRLAKTQISLGICCALNG